MDVIKNKKQKWILASFYYAFFLNGVVALVFGAIMPMLIEEYNIYYDNAGALLSIHSIGNLIASFLAGVLYQKIGKKNAVIFFVGVTMVGFSCILLLKAQVYLFIPFILSGIGRGGVSNMGNTVINDVSEGNPAPLNILHTFFAIGAFAISLYASFTFRLGLEWRFIIWTIIILSGLLITAFYQIKIEDGSNKKIKKKKKNNGFFLKSFDFYISSGILFFYVGVEYAVNGWIVTYLKDSGLMSLEMAQNILSILWVVIIFGRFGTIYISKKLDKRNILLISSVGVVLFFILFLLSSNIYLIIIWILGLGLCLSGIFPTTISNASMILSNSDMAMGTILAIAGIGGILMPYVTGFVAKRSGIQGGMIVITIAVISLFLFTLVNRFKKD